MADFWAQLWSIKNNEIISYVGVMCICELKTHHRFILGMKRLTLTSPTSWNDKRSELHGWKNHYSKYFAIFCLSPLLMPKILDNSKILSVCWLYSRYWCKKWPIFMMELWNASFHPIALQYNHEWILLNAKKGIKNSLLFPCTLSGISSHLTQWY